MVKNKFGGNRHKKMASKDAKVVHSRKTRFVKEEGEIYAKVTKMSGGGHAVIECSDGIERTLVIRNKFKKRNKRDNCISEGVYVLAGIRLWEVVAPKKKPKADLLCVYKNYDLKEIKSKNKDLGCLFNEKIENDEDIIEFDNNASNNLLKGNNKLINKTKEMKKSKVLLKEEEEKEQEKFDFDFDDI
jgi:initiation factor 1A